MSSRRASVRPDGSPHRSSPVAGNRRSMLSGASRSSALNAGGPGSAASASTADADASSDTARTRQARRDEAIRKKFEAELIRKGKSSRRDRDNGVVPLPAHQRVPGTVGALRPTQALTVRDSLSVVEASQLMAAKRADCVLVVDAEEHLAGIFTAKDLAFRVVAENLDPHGTLVRHIMTPSPYCVTVDAPAQDALEVMVARHFRHLPVCNADGDVVGLLDINKCMYEALEKMERAYNSSKKLYEAFEGVEREWTGGAGAGAMPAGMHPAAVMSFVEALRDRMACPDLQSILDHDADPAEVTPRTYVHEAARLMKDRRVTAVVVMEHGQVTGIFTTKDVVLRVIAAGLRPEACSVVRVMTPHPDVAPPTMTVIDALRKMHDGRYLNLPVVEKETGHLLAVVDVLRLTHFTLEQMNSVDGGGGQATGGQDAAEGPVWNKFFGYHADGDTESQLSGSHAPGGGAGGTVASSMAGHQEVYPNESASAVGGTEHHHAAPVEAAIGPHGGAGSVAPLPDTVRFPFKFRDPRDDTTHRFAFTPSEGVDAFRQVVFGKLNTEPRFEIGICYVDDEGDHVFIATSEDVIDAITHARRQGQDKVQLVITGMVVKEEPAVAAKPVAESREENGVVSAREKLGRRGKGPAKGSEAADNASGASSAPTSLPPEVLIGAGVGIGIVLVGLLVLLKLK